MGCWKCSCGHYIDVDFDRCIFCDRPKPGTVRQGDIEYTLTFLYVQGGDAYQRSVVIKGPCNIRTDSGHTRLYVTNIVTSGEATEYLSFDWTNSMPHGSPTQVWPVAEGGFEVTSQNPSFTVNGMEVGSKKVPAESGSVMLLAPTMAVKMEDFRGAAVIADSLSPIGARPPRPILEGELYRSPSGIMLYNCLNYLCTAKYSNAGVVVSIASGPTDWEYVNKAILGMFGLKFGRYREAVAALKEGRL